MDTIVRFAADGLMVVAGLLAVYWLLAKTPVAARYDRYTRVFMAGLTSYISAKFIGSIWQPAVERPFETLGVEPGASYLDNPGFPSDHMLFAVFLALAVWYATRNKKFALILFALAVGVGTARVAALVHTPLDIIGGVAFATLGAVWYVGINARKNKKTRQKVKKVLQ